VQPFAKPGTRDRRMPRRAWHAAAGRSAELKTHPQEPLQSIVVIDCQTASVDEADRVGGAEPSCESDEMRMQDNEQQIRSLVATWMAATKAGDAETILGLVTDDVVFLIPGRPPMRKSEFALAAKAQAAGNAPTFDGTSEIQEIQVFGEWAFMSSRLTVVATPAGGGDAVTRSGHTLSVFHRQGGRWLLARDANMLAPAGRDTH
jgi:uncharacterized protein (TIGR02246 family)